MHLVLEPMKEMLDIQRVCQAFEFDEEDIVIKLTGRYLLENPATFLKSLIDNQDSYDAFMKFFNICTMSYDPADCILGLCGVRYKYLLEFNPRYMLEEHSAERVFSAFVRRTIDKDRIFEATHLGLRLPQDYGSVV